MKFHFSQIFRNILTWKRPVFLGMPAFLLREQLHRNKRRNKKKARWKKYARCSKRLKKVYFTGLFLIILYKSTNFAHSIRIQTTIKWHL